ncbi:MAG: cell division protein SepF [Clostridia bacterium]|nr:cell division protein SepF [Clostridia bacterium]
MAVAAFRKIWDYLVGENEDELEDEEILENAYDLNEEEEEQDSGTEKRSGFWGAKRNVVQMPQTQSVRMKILKPTNYDPDVNEIISELKSKNGIVMNLEYVNKDIARRIIDTVSGAVTALDGRIEKVSNSIFVVAPYNYDIVNEPITREKSERTQAPWMK